ncbi:hypothetical protein ACA910_004222 [Epithemia clementina (nom. ined.)]
MAIQEIPCKLVAPESSKSPNDMVAAFFPKLTGRKRMHPSAGSNDAYNAAKMSSYNHDVVGAIRARDIDRLRELLNEEDQCFDACNINGEQLIHLACRRADLKTIKFLVVEAGVDVNVVDKMGRSILHDACWRPMFDADIMSFLLQVVDPTCLVLEDVRGHTPLNYLRKGDWADCNAFFAQNCEFIQQRAMKVYSVVHPQEASN